MARTSPKTKPDRVAAAAVPAEALAGELPQIDLPIRPPYPPMEARPAERLPTGDGWLYEPKWDGFRCLVFRRGRRLALQSKSGQPLDRYFPELTAAFLSLPLTAFELLRCDIPGGRREVTPSAPAVVLASVVSRT